MRAKCVLKRKTKKLCKKSFSFNLIARRMRRKMVNIYVNCINTWYDSHTHTHTQSDPKGWLRAHVKASNEGEEKVLLKLTLLFLNYPCQCRRRIMECRERCFRDDSERWRRWSDMEGNSGRRSLASIALLEINLCTSSISRCRRDCVKYNLFTFFFSFSKLVRRPRK